MSNPPQSIEEMAKQLAEAALAFKEVFGRLPQPDLEADRIYMAKAVGLIS